MPPPLPASELPASPLPPASPQGRSAISIEHFLGVKLFAWLGGVALFFGIIFFVKYAFEHNLIPPSVRVGIGFLSGLSLLIGGWLTHRKETYRVLAQAFCATGILVLYGVSFAAHAVYQLPLFSDTFTFCLMALVTGIAFGTAVRKEALVVAVLGMLGGFITPILLPMVQDHPAAWFGYVALLDIGLLALVVRGRWSWLSLGAAIGTLLLILMWSIRFFLKEKYHIGTATMVPMGILIGFLSMFLIAVWRMSRTGRRLGTVSVACGIMFLTALGFGFWFLAFEEIGERAPLLYGYGFLVHLAAITLSRLDRKAFIFGLISAAGTFIHLAIWTVAYLKPETMSTYLVIVLVFGSLHTLSPWFSPRDSVACPVPFGGRFLALWSAPLALVLMGLGLFILDDVDLLLWPAIIATSAACLVVCVRHRSTMPLLATIAITTGISILWMHEMSTTPGALHGLLGMVFSMAVLFCVGSIWLAPRISPQELEKNIPSARWTPLFASAMPFLLLILTVLHLEIPNPSAVFGTAFGLIALYTFCALRAKQAVLLPVVMVLHVLLLAVWHGHHFHPSQPDIPLGWMLGSYVLFASIPFLLRKWCESSRAPWIASALSGPLHFLLIHDIIQRAYPNEFMGLVPAAFALPSLGMLASEWRRHSSPRIEPAKTRLAWFGGVSLGFITLIFPIQLDHQWLTLAWAMEGAALILLFRAVPQRGLVATGCGLLLTVFVRLTLNPMVYLEYERSGTALLNWHLYVYGIASCSMLAGARWFPKEVGGPLHKRATGILCGFAGILLFLLMNLEIADFFTTPGARYIAFDFSGNFGRDMSYTIGWSLFALALLIIGILSRSKGARYASIGLLATALLKLFLHDLANIGSIYRIAALLCTGWIAFMASFLYQRFLPSEPPSREKLDS